MDDSGGTSLRIGTWVRIDPTPGTQDLGDGGDVITRVRPQVVTGGRESGREGYRVAPPWVVGGVTE